MNFYDEIEIEDMEFDEETSEYTYPCPCGDQFKITLEQIENGEDVATCPSCSLIIKVIYDPDDFCGDDDDEDGEGVILIGVQSQDNHVSTSVSVVVGANDNAKTDRASDDSSSTGDSSNIVSGDGAISPGITVVS
ncbi:Diphthamide biosynthesis protein 3 [Coemansia sp. IMI 203386]|nr:Diphthamide biosynthesis protein 3 [Coemansia sp. IMI 203386]